MHNSINFANLMLSYQINLNKNIRNIKDFYISNKIPFEEIAPFLVVKVK